MPTRDQLPLANTKSFYIMAASAPIASRFQLHGQTALVTGGTRGIGQAMVIRRGRSRRRHYSGSSEIFLVANKDNRSEPGVSSEIPRLRRLSMRSRNWVEQRAFTRLTCLHRHPSWLLLLAILKDGIKTNTLLNCAGVQRRHPGHQFPLEDWNEVYTSRDYHLKHTLSK